MTTIDDHVLILQVERANEQLEDRVASLEDADDPDRYDVEIMDHAVRISELASDHLEMGTLLATLIERMAKLEHQQDTLLRALLH